MTFRELPEDKRTELAKAAEKEFTMRRQADPELAWPEYKQAFSDGVRLTLKVMLP